MASGSSRQITRSGSSSSTSSQLTMKLLVHNSTGRVVCAEAGKDAVDFLFNLLVDDRTLTHLTVSIRTVINLVTSRGSTVGSIRNLHRSVEKLSRPTDGRQSGNLLRLTGASSSSSSHGHSYPNRSVYVKDNVYMITDNLDVTTLSFISAITNLNKLGIRDIGSLSEKTVDLGQNEGLQIVKASFKSKTVLTDVFLGRH